MKNNSHKRLKQILKREQQIPQDIKDLYYKLKGKIHGNMDINTEKLKKLINLTISETPLVESFVQEISVANKYKKTEENSQSLDIIISIRGRFNGKIYFETGSGTNTNYNKPIYYIWDSYSGIVSDLEVKIINYYKNTYKTILEESFLNIALNKNLYLNLDTKFNKYELWYREPAMYSSTMEGEYDSDDNYLICHSKNAKLNKLYEFDDFKDFIKSKHCDWWTEKTEWRVYGI